MEIDIKPHAIERMARYNITEKEVIDCLENPDIINESNTKRMIYNKKLNGYVLRVIEESKEIKSVITTYKAGSGRYGI